MDKEGLHMVMTWIFTGIILISVISSILLGRGGDLAAAVPKGAQAGIELAIAMSGSICLWTGVGNLMEHIGVTHTLSRLLQPIIGRIFPSTKKDARLAGCLSANICANFLGLGNAATPMGIQAARHLADPKMPDVANDELCRLIVLNTASIQLIPATVAAVRSSLGCTTPFDILPAVWITSICSAGLGVAAAWGMGKLCRHD